MRILSKEIACLIVVLLTGCAASNSVRSVDPVSSPTEVEAALAAGNDRFKVDTPLSPRRDSSRVRALAAGQKPHTAVLTCSDSRVPPELIFDQGLGDLFVVRTAGQVADRAAIASLEYAVAELGVSVLLVMGHSQCGAVKAAATINEAESAGSDALDALLAAIRPNLPDEAARSGTSSERGQVDGVAGTLIDQSAMISKAHREGRLRLVRALYHLESGHVERW